ncbi:hypothetical protein [Vibrio panuliri]|uniref:Uncharacterized protein n=1 Tax=Vibrio panuliri TaxID=1381081 RepID=A0A1Q9HQA2_9VIBR|nr:hypothetical protein [Vibrio panuliri]KAB1457931.1 hypothetical protein F7O85_09425 [Vibrio panuliri]OLQ93057.1 hypothetical protein BIY22_00770 [Vibrio panuliri]OLQ95632.1 hypothetical protein BIY20_06210 [Vibrio panuliri]
MERDQKVFDANCESDLSNLQKMIADLIAYLELKASSSQQETHLMLRQSQHRLLTYKDLLLHAQHLEESELLLMYTELSKYEKAIAKLGDEALGITIDRLEQLSIK